MAHLMFTTDAFRPLDRPVPGLPVQLDNDMRLVEPACAWLMHVALVRGRTRSPQTWRSVSTTLIQPGLEFRLGIVALIERLWTVQDGRPVGVRLAG